MTPLEFGKQKVDLRREYDSKLTELKKRYLLSQNNVRKGQIIEDNGGIKIRVEEFGFKRSILSDELILTYTGTELRKDYRAKKGSPKHTINGNRVV